MNYLQMKKKAMLNYVSGGRLPSEYQEVEWIGSTNYELNYIDSGIVADDDVGIKCTMEFNSTSTNMWTGGGMLDDTTRLGTPVALNSTQLNFNWKKFNVINVPYSLDTPYEFKGNFLNDRKQTFGGVDYMTNISTISASKNIYLFTMNKNGVPQLMANTKIYSYQLSKGADIVRDFVPCYRKADGEIGLYDTVTKIFYTNQGSGTFTKGQDV